MYTCVDGVSRVSVSSVSLKGGSQERKGHKGTGGGRTGYNDNDNDNALFIWRLMQS